MQGIIKKVRKAMDIMAGLNTVFKQVFGEGFKEQGFVKIKGRQPYLVRIVGGEIIHIITCRNEWCGEQGFKEFSIRVNVATVYSDSIMDLSLSPYANINYLDSIYEIYTEMALVDFDKEYGHSIYTFIYKAGDDISMREAMEHALEETKKVMMPFLDEVADLESCANYFARFKEGCIIPPEYNENDGSFSNDYEEGLLLIKTNSHDDFVENVRESIDREIKKYNVQFNPDRMRKDLEEWRIEVITNRDKIYNNPKIYTAALEELERRKHANIETLRSYGLNI
ncbi:MAG: hypothetical protein K2K56_04590 [Lachnospiraceae bacterium]|nr:hypothetical protein [Lachnospiraceae bacterium]MDE6625631.1 hypothetical protein [Lachnospiraceae bacterium]